MIAIIFIVISIKFIIVIIDIIITTVIGIDLWHLQNYVRFIVPGCAAIIQKE